MRMIEYVDQFCIEHKHTNQINEHRQFLPKYPGQQQQHYNQELWQYFLLEFVLNVYIMLQAVGSNHT